MATMYPHAPFGAKSQAEVRLFDTLKENLDDSYTVFYSVAWLAPRRPGERPADGESDFVVLHPKKGLLTIEVKGGQISYDPAAGWHTTPHGAAHSEPIRDPFMQARDNKYSLRRKLKLLPGWRNRHILDGHAVAFPDSVVPDYPPRPDADPAIVMGALDLPHIAERIEEIYRFWTGRESSERFSGFDRAAVALIIDTLARKWDLRAPRLGDTLTVETERIVRLTEKQFELLDFLSEHRRAAIAGPAGSGKTMIALEKARRLAAEGFHTLFLCYNRPLADYLRTIMPAQTNLVINSFHRFCGEMIRGTLDAQDESEHFYTTVLPNALLDAISLLPQSELFDALVIDEGQDFRPEWFAVLEFLLAEKGQDILYVFYDDNQNLYHCDLRHLGLSHSFRLYENCRNTRHIYAALRPYYRGTHPVKPVGPGGEPVEVRSYASQSDLVEQLVWLVSQLVFEEGVPARSIVLLSPRTHEHGPLANVDHIGYFALTDAEKPTDRELRMATIHSFKGLERPIVVLLLGPDNQTQMELLYVGMSRACNRLYIFKPGGMKLAV